MFHTKTRRCCTRLQCRTPSSFLRVTKRKSLRGNRKALEPLREKYRSHASAKQNVDSLSAESATCNFAPEGVNAMATRAAKAEPADWRAAFRRSLARALQLGGRRRCAWRPAFSASRSVSYHQTDPSFSTAAAARRSTGWAIPGAWAADWRCSASAWSPCCCCRCSMPSRASCGATPSSEETPHGPPLVAHGGAAAARHGAARHRAAPDVRAPGGSLPAASAGSVGLLGAGAVHARSPHRLPEAAQVLDHPRPRPREPRRRRRPRRPGVRRSTGRSC